MNNIKDVYQKLLEKHENINIKLNANEEIFIKHNDKTIKGNKYGAQLIYQGESIAHSHDENYEELYKSIEYYLENEPNYFIKQHKKDFLIKWMVIFGLLLSVVVIKVLVS